MSERTVDIDALAAAIALTIDPAHRAGVETAFAVLAQAAAAMSTIELPPTVEPAPVYRHDGT